MKRSLGVAILLTVTGLAGCARSVPPSAEVADFAPPFTLIDSGGASVGLADLTQNGPVLLYFNMAYG